jgi:hypothetical protein
MSRTAKGDGKPLCVPMVTVRAAWQPRKGSSSEMRKVVFDAKTPASKYFSRLGHNFVLQLNYSRVNRHAGKLFFHVRCTF